MITKSKKKNNDRKSIELSAIVPSPENDAIYGSIRSDNDLIDLANDIIKNGILEPIVITEDNFIVSGHRRYHAAKLAGVETVNAIVLAVRRSDFDTHSYKKLLRQYNFQRHKNGVQRLNEKLLDLDPDIAYKQLIDFRTERDQQSPSSIEIRGTKKRASISGGKRHMLDRVLQIVKDLKEYWPLTVRGVHYQLLNNPPLRHSKKPDSTYVNDHKCYADLVGLIARARLTGEIPFDVIGDETRPVSNTRFNRDLPEFIDLECYQLFRGYRRDLLQSQYDHFEMVLEKMTLQNIVQPIANEFCLPMTIARGYCSLEPRRKIVERYRASGKDRLVLIVMSDHDPDGMEICESLGRSFRDDFGVKEIKIHKALLTIDQIKKWKLPPNGMEAKETSSNYKKFVKRFGTDVFELEAVSPPKMQEALSEFIESLIDIEKFNEEIAEEKKDAVKLGAIKETVIEAIRELDLENQP